MLHKRSHGVISRENPSPFTYHGVSISSTIEEKDSVFVERPTRPPLPVECWGMHKHPCVPRSLELTHFFYWCFSSSVRGTNAGGSSRCRQLQQLLYPHPSWFRRTQRCTSLEVLVASNVYACRIWQYLGIGVLRPYSLCWQFAWLEGSTLSGQGTDYNCSWCVEVPFLVVNFKGWEERPTCSNVWYLGNLAAVSTVYSIGHVDSCTESVYSA